MVDTEAEADRLDAEIAEVCGVINAATARLVRLIGQVLETESWAGWAIRSPEHWVAWKCGVGRARARSLVAMARRLPELPETRASFEAGELAENQVAVVARHAPTTTDGEVAELARQATVCQLRRALGSYRFAEELTPVNPDAGRAEEPPEEPRRVSFGYDDEGAWRLSAVLPVDEGALWERALAEARESLFRAQQSGEHDKSTKVSWAEALIAVADRSLAASGAGRPHRDRHLVMVHVGATPGDSVSGHVHLGPELPAGLRQYLSCDTRVRAVLESGGTPVSVGRSYRTVPERTRIVIEERDGGCRVPGCDRRRWLHVHHIRHWEDGGPTDTANLLALCSFHHRLLHRGGLGIVGNADDPDSVVFSDQRGRVLGANGRPIAPRGPFSDAARDLGIPRAELGPSIRRTTRPLGRALQRAGPPRFSRGRLTFGDSTAELGGGPLGCT